MLLYLDQKYHLKNKKTNLEKFGTSSPAENISIKNKKLNNYISFWNILGFLGSIIEKDNFKKLLQAKSYSFDDDLSEVVWW